MAKGFVLTTHPDLFANDSALGVAVNSKDQVFATDGFSVSTVHFDGTPETVTALPFTNSYTLVSRIRFDTNDQVNLLVAYFNGGGTAGVLSGATYTPYLQLDSSFHYARNIDFTPDGHVWLDANPDFGDPGMVLQYDASGKLLSSQNVSYYGFGPTALSHDPQGREYASTFDGTILDLSGATPTPIASVAGTWAGPSIGTVTAFAIDHQGDIFLAVDKSPAFGPIEGDILRINRDKSIDVL